jgi:hypothetical protein
MIADRAAYARADDDQGLAAQIGRSAGSLLRRLD